MDAEVSQQIGAELYERTGARTAHRNGYRPRTCDTRLGTVELQVPKITPGSFYPSLLEPRRRAERALQAVICEAYVKGISTRKVDDLVQALGIDGISKSEVSRIAGTGLVDRRPVTTRNSNSARTAAILRFIVAGAAPRASARRTTFFPVVGFGRTCQSRLVEEIARLDVGQGEAALVQEPGEVQQVVGVGPDRGGRERPRLQMLEEPVHPARPPVPIRRAGTPVLLS
jgi:hypothetical protein